jgi:hypothetical protein
VALVSALLLNFVTRQKNVFVTREQKKAFKSSYCCRCEGQHNEKSNKGKHESVKSSFQI